MFYRVVAVLFFLGITSFAFGQPTICHDTSARFFLQNDSVRYNTTDPVATADGNILITGSYVLDAIGKTGAYLMKMDYNGNVLWNKRYDSANANYFSQFYYQNILELMDGSLLLAGRIFYDRASGNMDMIFTKTDNTGNIIWSKIFTSRFWTNGSGTPDYYWLQQMKQDTASGDVFIEGSFLDAGSSLIRMDMATGNMVWSKSYPTYYFETPYGLDIKPDEIRMWGRLSINTDSYTSIYRINKSTGDTIRMRFFATDDTAAIKLQCLYPNSLTILKNGNYVIDGQCIGSTPFMWNGVTPLYQDAFLEFDSNLNFIDAYSFKSPINTGNAEIKATFFPDGSGLFSMNRYISVYSSDDYFVWFNKGQILKQQVKHYRGELIPNNATPLLMPDGGYIRIRGITDSITGSIYGEGVPRIEVVKLHLTDTASNCLGAPDSSTFLSPFHIIPYSHGFEAVFSDVFQENPNKTIAARDLVVNKLPGCFQVSYCDSLKLLPASSTICVSQDLQVVARKNMGCGSAVHWNYDTTAISSPVQQNDSLFLFHFKAPWTGYLYGNMQGCSTITDSVYIQAVNPGAPLNLGPDTVICPGNTIILNAGTGYTGYQWQDGSTNPVFTVTQPGKYYVQAVAACGSMLYYDTVIVAAHPPVFISIGADRTKCNNDTLHLSADPGFISYAWSPNYNISSSTASNIVIDPVIDTSYSLKAEKEPGCFAFDTVHITVYHSSVIDLGNDTSFCSGGSAVLNAGSGFNTYQWNTGSINAAITVNATGAYSVIGTDARRCKSYDTLNILSVFPLPIVKLDHDATLCTDSIRVLDAGNFAVYAWQDGSASRTFLAQGLGVYYVDVTDNNGCKGSDTARITTFLALPANFLPADTTVCSYRKLVVEPMQNFTEYLWSTNSTVSSITVTQPGLYWLQAKDDKGCSGRDTIIIDHKQCPEGLYVPTGFTPNGDRMNDKFKAILLGDIQFFELTVYNRFGHVVFKTSDTDSGWDGTIGGVKQDPGTYVWMCRYQLAGETEQLAKGTVVLIR